MFPYDGGRGQKGQKNSDVFYGRPASSTREAHMLLFYATRLEQNLFKIVSYFFLRCFFSTFNLGSYKRLLDVGFNNFLGCHKSIKTLRQPEIEFGPIVFPSIAIGH